VVDRVPVKVRRLDVARFRVFQVGAAAASGLAVLARRAPWVPVWIVAGAAMTIAIALGLRSYRWLGRRDLSFDSDQIFVGEGGAVVRARDVRLWAAGEGEVRVHTNTGDTVWRFLAEDTSLDILRAKLARMCGRPRRLVPRGSPRARAAVGGLALAAGALFAAGVGASSPALGFSAVAVLSVLLGAFFHLSRKVVRPAP